MYFINVKKVITALLCTLSMAAHAKRLGTLRDDTESLRPYGLRRTFERGFGDRYYHGLPAYHYRHLWPRWKETILDNQNLWRSRQMPKWIPYYNYPYITWPNSYYLFGVPYYNDTRPRYISDTQQQTK